MSTGNVDGATYDPPLACIPPSSFVRRYSHLTGSGYLHAERIVPEKLDHLEVQKRHVKTSKNDTSGQQYYNSDMHMCEESKENFVSVEGPYAQPAARPYRTRQYMSSFDGPSNHNCCPCQDRSPKSGTP